MPAPTVACVVVTRDRRELLNACLAAVAAQTAPVHHLVVVDNASSDGTPELVRSEHAGAQLLALGRNIGSAGGFHAGIEAALGKGTRWIWLLDDDTIARPDALERLLAAPWQTAGLPAPAVLASRVDWTDGEPHPMNRPMLLRREPGRMVAAAGAGLLPIRAATFVSLLVDAAAVERHGPPDPAFFFQADDIDFTARILRTEPGYLVPDSVVEHRTASAHDYTSDPFRFRFHLRNTLLMMRGRAWSPVEKAALGWVVLSSSARFLRAHGTTKETTEAIAQGVREGLTVRVV